MNSTPSNPTSVILKSPARTPVASVSPLTTISDKTPTVLPKTVQLAAKTTLVTVTPQEEVETLQRDTEVAEVSINSDQNKDDSIEVLVQEDPQPAAFRDFFKKVEQGLKNAALKNCEVLLPKHGLSNTTNSSISISKDNPEKWFMDFQHDLIQFLQKEYELATQQVSTCETDLVRLREKLAEEVNDKGRLVHKIDELERQLASINAVLKETMTSDKQKRDVLLEEQKRWNKINVVLTNNGFTLNTLLMEANKKIEELKEQLDKAQRPNSSNSGSFAKREVDILKSDLRNSQTKLALMEKAFDDFKKKVQKEKKSNNATVNNNKTPLKTVKTEPLSSPPPTNVPTFNFAKACAQLSSLDPVRPNIFGVIPGGSPQLNKTPSTPSLLALPETSESSPSVPNTIAELNNRCDFDRLQRELIDSRNEALTEKAAHEALKLKFSKLQTLARRYRDETATYKRKYGPLEGMTESESISSLSPKKQK